MPENESPETAHPVVTAGRGVDDHTPMPIARESAVRERTRSNGDIRILVMDDDPLVCQLVKRTLAHHSFTLDTVHDPHKMAARLSEHTYDLIILDYLIPGVSFEQILGQLQQYQASASVIV